MPGWKRLRNQLKAMSAHPIPKLTFVRHAPSGTAPPEVVVVGPLPPEDGVWVDGNVVHYLPTISQAVKMLTLTNQEITTLSNRIAYEIGLVQSRRLKAAHLPRSSFDFGDWDAEAIEANNKRDRRRAERLREELEKGTLTMIINGRSVTINELNDMVGKNKRTAWLRLQV
ncbi:hypothetical protein B0T24DRAFT_626138 [Lasiosphaeria ovina]|uniref:Uncharacterized protein n=1 Tax=Lasiosphaeria ovina TaxID=92902 RepID=A0AAE0N835_9PEZI|nr:hypothetical protein B0T24DRAFT_626138 [Lasiosphaeria ovina]